MSEHGALRPFVHRSGGAPRAQCIALAITVTVALTPIAPAGAESEREPSPAGKWAVGSFDLDGGFSFSKPSPLRADGVAFEFLNRPDTAYLTTDHPAFEKRLLGDLTGATLSARVGVSVTPGTVFEYFGEPDLGSQPANVRLYFETDTSLGDVVCPCAEKGVSSYWWSHQVSIDLEALTAGDRTLSVTMSDPGQWTDSQGRRGDSDSAHRGYFAQAAADVDHIGLSFGGGRFFHNGVGIEAGTGSGVFRLVSYTAVIP